MVSFELAKSFGIKQMRQLKTTAWPTIFKRRCNPSPHVGEPSPKKARSAYEKRERHRVC
jgi:hypothetical protein